MAIRLQCSLAESLICVIKGAGALRPSDAFQIHGALHDGPFGEDQTKRINDYVDTLVQGPTHSAHKSTAGTTVVTKQTLKRIAVPM